MKTKSSAFEVVAAPLLLAGPAVGAFVGVTFQQLPLDESNILTYRIYAQFDGTQGTSGNDGVLAVADCSPDLLVLRVQGGTFFQHPANTHGDGDLSPDPSLCMKDPTACWDTFVTIGKLTNVDDVTILSANWSGFGPDSLVTYGAWGLSVPNPPQGVPGLADNPADQVVLIQLSSIDGVAFCGAMSLLVRSNSVVTRVCVNFNTGCFADTDGDEVVGLNDFLTVLTQWGFCPSCPGDVTANGTVNIADFLQVLARWGPCPECPFF